MKQTLPLLFMLALLALPQTAHAQDTLIGDWVLTFMMQEGTSQTMHLNADVVQDSLQLTAMARQGEHRMEKVSFSDDVLRFVFPTGHGSIACTLYKKEAEERSLAFAKALRARSQQRWHVPYTIRSRILSTNNV